MNTTTTNLEKSKGHIAFIGICEYFEYDGSIYRAPIDAYIQANGTRVSARFECYVAQKDLCLLLARKSASCAA